MTVGECPDGRTKGGDPGGASTAAPHLQPPFHGPSPALGLPGAQGRHPTPSGLRRPGPGRWAKAPPTLLLLLSWGSPARLPGQLPVWPVTYPSLSHSTPPSGLDSHPQTCNIQGPTIPNREGPVLRPPCLPPSSSPARVSPPRCETGGAPAKLLLREPVTFPGTRVSAEVTS